MKRFLPVACDNLYLRKLSQGAQTDLSIASPRFTRGSFYLQIFYRKKKDRHWGISRVSVFYYNYF